MMIRPGMPRTSSGHPCGGHPPLRRPSRRRLAAPAGFVLPASGLLLMAAPAAASAATAARAAAPASAAAPARAALPARAAVPVRAAAPAAARDGWIRLAHLSPNTPPVDVYLYSFGGAQPMIVLKHVGYGAVSPYERVRSGEYTVAMRAAGAPRSSQPVLSTSVHIAPGGAYTVAGLGPKSGLRLQVLRDRLRTPKGTSLVRVIQASLRDHRVTVTAGSSVLARGLAFGNVTRYRVTRPGPLMVHVMGAVGMVTRHVRLTAGSIHTLVVLDGGSGRLMIDNLEDAAGSAVMPHGGAPMGLGGTAPVPAPSAAPWAAAAMAGALCVLAGAYWLRRVRHQARHAR